jgi:hypothetical protein
LGTRIPPILILVLTPVQMSPCALVSVLEWQVAQIRERVLGHRAVTWLGDSQCVCDILHFQVPMAVGAGSGHTYASVGDLSSSPFLTSPHHLPVHNLRRHCHSHSIGKGGNCQMEARLYLFPEEYLRAGQLQGVKDLRE